MATTRHSAPDNGSKFGHRMLAMAQAKWKSDAGKVVKRINVRRDETEKEVWHTAGIPATVRSDSWIPLQTVHLPGTGTDAVFMQSGHILGAVTHPADMQQPPSGNGNGSHHIDRLKGAVTEIGVINGEVLRFDITTPGIVRVLMRHSRTLYLSYRVTGNGSATWQFHGAMPEFPALAIVSADETNLSESFGAMNLSGAGGTHGTLSPADEKTVSDRVKSAYFRLKNRAAAMGLFLQPTLARYRLVDASGDTLAVSPPVMAGASGGFQCGNELRLTSTDNLATLQGGTITARAYRVSLKGFTTMPHPWRRMVKSVVVETLPQIDPVDADGLCPSSISTNGSATTVAVRPAGYSATAASNTIRQRNLIIKNLAQADADYLIQGTFPYPFDTVPTETRVGLRDDAPAPLERIPACRPRRDDASFGASLLTGNELLLADRRQEGFKGYPPACYAATTGHGTDASCAAAVCVRTGTPDGNEATIVATSEGSAADITAFSPLLVFPDATATSLTIIMTRGEQVLTETYPLTPVAGSGLAYYLSPDLLPLFPRATASAPTLPEPTPATDRAVTNHGMLTVCHPSRLSAPIAEGICTGGSVVAIEEAPRSRSTWDFSRRKTLLFGSGGITVVTLDAKSGLRSSARLDNRPVECREAVCCANREHGLSFIAVAGGDLVEVSQSAVRTLLRHCRGQWPGWCGRFGEIWLGGDGNQLRRISHTGHLPEEIETDFGNSASLRPLQWGAGLLLAGGGMLLDTFREQFPAEGVRMALTTRHIITKRVRLARINMFAASIQGNITLAGDNGSGIGEPLVRLTVDGALNAPLTVNLTAPHRNTLETAIDAQTGLDAELRPPHFA